MERKCPDYGGSTVLHKEELLEDIKKGNKSFVACVDECVRGNLRHFGY